MALDAGIPVSVFWDSSLSEILDMLESHVREERRKRKEKILDHFIMAEAMALNLVSMLPLGEKITPPKPWDYYQRMFDEEKEIFETEKAKRDFEIYMEDRKAYIEEFNRRRKQGIQ